MTWASTTRILWRRVHPPWLWGGGTALFHLDILMLFLDGDGRWGPEALPSWAHFLVRFLDPCHKASVFILMIPGVSDMGWFLRPDDQEQRGNPGSVLGITLLRMSMLSVGPTFPLTAEGVWPELISLSFS